MSYQTLESKIRGVCDLALERQEQISQAADAIREKGVNVSGDGKADIDAVYDKAFHDMMMARNRFDYFFEYDNNSELYGKINFEDTQNGTSFFYTFKNAGKNITSPPLFDTGKATDFDSMFRFSEFTSIPQYNTAKVVNFNGTFLSAKKIESIAQLDTGNAVALAYTFSGTKISQYTFISTSKCINFQYAFLSCTNLNNVSNINVSAVTADNNCKGIFQGCTALESIEFSGEIPVHIDFKDCPLSVECMKNIISHLRNYSGTSMSMAYTVSFSEDCWNALEESQAAPDGGTWKAYVANHYAWNV